MDEFLTRKQVQELLQVDRITVYRMLNDGRIKGVKVGNQWRFSRNGISRLLGAPTNEGEAEVDAGLTVSDFPSDCVEKLQDVFAGILGVGAISVNLNGDPLTQPVFSNPFCRMMLSNDSCRKACQMSWRKIALRSTGNPRFHECHAGLRYLRSPIKMEGKNVAWMVTGQFYTTPNNPQRNLEKIKNLSILHGLQFSDLEAAFAEIPVLKASQQEKVQDWAPKVAATVQSMLCERSELVTRLEKIAELSAMHSNLKNQSK